MRAGLLLPAAALALFAVLSFGSGTAAQPALVNVSLAPGWNNIVYFGPTAPVAQAVAPLGAAFQSAWEFDASTQSWRAYDPRVPAFSDLTQLTAQRAVWLLINDRATLPMTLPETPAPLFLLPGLNNIAWVGPETALTEALAPAAGRIEAVWRWDTATQSWQGAVVGAPAVSDFATFTPGHAYSVAIGPGSVAPIVVREVGRPPGLRICHPFQSRQPDLAELRAAFNRAGFGLLVPDPTFALPPLESDPAGDGDPVPAYIPPTLLKAIAWTESSWRQAAYDVPRGAHGRVITSTSCAYGVMQVLSGMEIGATPTLRQERIGGDHQHNIAAGALILADKWNSDPAVLPVVRPRLPGIVEDWYYAVWAYHCFGERCTREFGLHDNPDDPLLTWPRPDYNSPEQLASRGRFTRADYP